MAKLIIAAILAILLVLIGIDNENTDLISRVAVIFSALSLVYVSVDSIEKMVDNKARREVYHLNECKNDVQFKESLQKVLDEFDQEKKIIDSIHIHEAEGYTDHRKTAYIIYHKSVK